MDHPESFVGKNFGKCKVEKPLKFGGQGYSFVGFDDEVQKDRVVKVSRMPLQMSTDDEKIQIENLKKEGFILARLRHPQIVDMIEQGEAYGYRYMIVDRIHGYDFNKIIRLLKKKQQELKCEWNKLINPITALAIIRSALEPLAYAHTVKIQLPGEGMVKGLAHRDISAGNLLLGLGHEYEGMVHLIDFGIAKTNYQQSMTINTKIIGTIRYMSPMRLMKPNLGEKKDTFWKDFKQTQHDVHSMGCFFYELLTGETHINYTDVQQSLAAICNPSTYSDLYDKNRIFDKKIQEVFRRSIIFPDFKINPNLNQYKTAGEMLEAIKQVYTVFVGNRDHRELLREFVDYIHHPEKILKVVDEDTTSIIRYSAPMNAYLGLRDNKLSKMLSLMVLLLIFFLGVFFAVDYFSRIRVLDPGELAAGYNLQIPVDMPVQKAVFTNETGTYKSPAPKVNIRTAGYQNSKTNKRQNKNSKSKMSIPTKISSENLELSVFHEVQKLMRQGTASGDREAFQKINTWIAQSGTQTDPLFWVLKAELMHRKNPTSEQIRQFLEKIRGKKSRLVDDNWMVKKSRSLLK